MIDSVATLRRNVAAVLGDYEGSMGGKYPFRLSITAQQPDSQLVGVYYYLSQHKPIELQGFVAPTGEIWLREFTPQLSAEEEETQRLRTWDEPATQPRQPFARFMVRRAPDGTLAGTWQEANSNSNRSLPVRLMRYCLQGVVQRAHVSEQRYFGEFSIPVFTVSDPGVTRQLHQIFGVEKLTGLTLADLREEHRNHQRNDIAQGFAGVESEVTHNNQGLLSVDLHSELTGANVSHSYQSVVVDLRTGRELTNEIDPAHQQQFLAASELKLQQQLTEYIAKEYPAAQQDSTDEDLAGLRSQHVSNKDQLDAMSLHAGSVQFHYWVQYEAMSNLTFKQFQNQFWVSFTFTELQPYLKPDSPLRRLAQR
jgi:hypothetical protein